MTPRSLTYDRRRKGLPAGRIRFSLRTTSKRTAARRRRRLDDLLDRGDVDILERIAEGEIDVASVCRIVEREGREAARTIRHELRRREAGEIPTVREAADLYLADYETKRQPATVHSRTIMLRQLCREELAGGRPLGELLVTDVVSEDLEAAIRAVSSTPSTQETFRLTLSGLYTWLIGRESERARRDGGIPYLEDNPAKRVERREMRTRAETASRAQVKALLDAAEVYQRAYLRTFLHLGLRLAELIHLRYHLDLEIETWTLRVQPRGPEAACPCRQCQSEGWSPKTARSERTLLIPEMPGALREAIEDYVALEPREAGDWLFTNPRTGRVWHAFSLQRDLERLCGKAGVKYGRDVPGGITPHTLRHTCATEMIRAGVRESVVAEILGDTVETVVAVYVHLTPEDLAEGISRTPEYVG